MVPVAATLFARSAGADLAAAALAARDSVGAVLFFQGALDLHALWTRGHRLGPAGDCGPKAKRAVSHTTRSRKPASDAPGCP